MKDEIIIYQANEASTRIEVQLAYETIWLNQAQIVTLFDSSKANISEHLKSIFKSKELNEVSVVRNFRTTASDGKTYNIKYYNLDAIISVGYRVNSLRGTQFRIWANNVLKDYLLKGYALNNRMNRIEDHINILTKRIDGIDLHIQSGEIPKQGIFFNGQVFDAYAFFSEIIKKAQHYIILIDNYVDETVLIQLSKRNPNVSATIYTGKISQQLLLDLDKHNKQYPPIEIKQFSESHDRFIIIDQTELYHIGASLKDLGKKWFAFSRMDSLAADLLKKLES